MISYILSKYSEQCDWNQDTQVELLCEYIRNQEDTAAFEDFLKRAADEEVSCADSCRKCGSDLDDERFCEDETCPYSDWPQNTPLAAFEIPTKDAEEKYGVQKRQV